MSKDLFPDTFKNLDAQIFEVRREIEVRKKVFPRWVERGTLKADTAKRRLAAMEAVLQTLLATAARF